MSLPGCNDYTQRTSPSVQPTIQQPTVQQPQPMSYPSIYAPQSGFGGFFNNLKGSIFGIAEGITSVLAQNAPMIAQMYMMDKMMNSSNCCGSHSHCAPQRPIVIRSYRNTPFIRHFSRPMPMRFTCRPRKFTFSRPELYMPRRFNGFIC